MILRASDHPWSSAALRHTRGSPGRADRGVCDRAGARRVPRRPSRDRCEGDPTGARRRGLHPHDGDHPGPPRGRQRGHSHRQHADAPEPATYQHNVRPRASPGRSQCTGSPLVLPGHQHRRASPFVWQRQPQVRAADGPRRACQYGDGQQGLRGRSGALVAQPGAVVGHRRTPGPCRPRRGVVPPAPERPPAGGHGRRLGGARRRHLPAGRLLDDPPAGPSTTAPTTARTRSLSSRRCTTRRPRSRRRIWPSSWTSRSPSCGG